jgi:hypothetical protein
VSRLGVSVPFGRGRLQRSGPPRPGTGSAGRARQGRSRRAVRRRLPFASSGSGAVSVWVQGLKVGYLSRDDARRYRPGLLALEEGHGKPIALAGAIVGGGMRAIRQQKAKNFEQARAD